MKNWQNFYFKIPPISWLIGVLELSKILGDPILIKCLKFQHTIELARVAEVSENK